MKPHDIHLFFIVCSLLASGCLGQNKESGVSIPVTSPPPQQKSESSTYTLKLGEGSSLQNEQGPAYSQDWSSEGLLAVAGYGKVKLWDFGAAVKVRTLGGHKSYVWGVAWSPDGSTLASASQDGTVRLWKAFPDYESSVLETGWAFCVEWSPDGRRLYIGTDAGEIQVWDVAKKEKLYTWKCPAGSPIISVALSPDGKTIASGELTGEIYFWDEGGGLFESIKGYTTAQSDVNGLAWSPDGKTLASAHQDGKVRLWDTSSWQLTQTIDAHEGWVRGVAWSPDGRFLASSGEDKFARFWDMQTDKKANQIKHNFLPVWSVAWSHDGKYVTSGSGAYNDLRSGFVIVWHIQKSCIT